MQQISINIDKNIKIRSYKIIWFITYTEGQNVLQDQWTARKSKSPYLFNFLSWQKPIKK